MRRILLALTALGGLATGQGWTVDARTSIERAAGLVETREFSLARIYLEPALIDPRLTPTERSRAYYIRGFSFLEQSLHTSALRDFHTALEFNPDNAVVLATVADLHLNGLGIDRNAELAAELLRQAADAGLADGQVRLGYLYLEGKGVDQNLTTARALFERAARSGSTEAMIALAQSWRAALTDDPDPQQALRWLERAAELGSADALCITGFLLEGEESGAPNPIAARAAFAQAAGAGSTLAMVKIAHMLLAGTGGPRDPIEARQYFERAAAGGHPGGSLGLGYLYEAGIGVNADAALAHQHYTYAADAGDLDAQRRLAHAALAVGAAGATGPADHAAASRWLAAAAAQGDLGAMNDYAWLLATSRDAALRDGARAVSLALRATADHPEPGYLDTLAAAYAEAGRFGRAVATQREALAHLDSAAEPDLRGEFEAHLAAFEAGRAWRE